MANTRLAGFHKPAVTSEAEEMTQSRGRLGTVGEGLGGLEVGWGVIGQSFQCKVRTVRGGIWHSSGVEFTLPSNSIRCDCASATCQANATYRMRRVSAEALVRKRASRHCCSVLGKTNWSN